MTGRDQPFDAISQKAKTAQNADKLHDWPPEVGSCDDETFAIFKKNQCFRAYDDWNDADLMELARVSKMQSMVLYEMEKLEDEGFILMGGKNGNTPIENPRNRAISTATSGITSTLRRLGITAAHATPDRQGRAAKARAASEREARGVMSRGDADERSRSGTTLM